MTYLEVLGSYLRKFRTCNFYNHAYVYLTFLL